MQSKFTGAQLLYMCIIYKELISKWTTEMDTQNLCQVGEEEAQVDLHM